MTGTRVASTPRASMHALAFRGITVSDCHVQICQMLRSRFGDEYVLLFAEPVAGENSLDWYSPIQGQPRRLADLAQAEREPIEARLAAMGQAMLDHASELKKSPDELKATRGGVLELALRYPSADCIYVLGAQPVVTGWGFGPGTPGVEPQNLARRLAPRAATPRPAPAPEQQRDAGAGWLWWLLPLLLLALLAIVCFSSFGGLAPLGGAAFWNIPLPAWLGGSGMETPSVAAREAELTDLLARARLHASTCGAQGSPASGSLHEELAIPENASDTAFMSGSWICETGLYKRQTGQPVKFEFSFGEDGRGLGIVHEQGDRCQGAARASLDDGILRLVLEPQHCAKSGDSYSALQIECRKISGSKTSCRGVNQDGTAWAAAFHRSR